LNIIVPHGEDAYYRNRPSLGIKNPIKLDDMFGLNPDLAQLRPIFDSGQMAAIHAVGSGDRTRSHFEAMSAMERGANTDRGEEKGGWLARHLLAQAGGSSPMRAVALTNTMPQSLSGATEAVAIDSLADYRLAVADDKRTETELALESLYAGHDDVFAEGARNTLVALKALRDYDSNNSKPENSATYPDTSLGRGLAQVAYLVRKDVGLEIACLDAADRGGWDTHVAQAPWFAGLMDDLGKSLAAFHQDMGKEMSRVTVLVQTEFGRRVAENSGFGTDHGRASMMLAMGGGVHGGKVYGEWPGLEPDQLEEPGDLRVTTDYRDVLAELLTMRLHSTTTHQVFPGHQRKRVGMFA
jgi:uncharacterized protein (DUF1501 family)